MIAELTGRLVRVGTQEVVINVGGMGFRCFVTAGALHRLPPLQEEVRLFIHTLVREDAIHLYGFDDEAERDLFEILLTVSGVGPRLALALLSHLSVDKLVAAVRVKDAKTLTQVPGVGKKTAERLLLELKDRLKGWDAAAGAEEIGGSEADGPEGGPAADAGAALVALGYAQAEADDAVRRALQGAGAEKIDVSDLVREALRLIAQGTKR